MSYSKISGFSDEISEDICKQFDVLNKLGIKYFEPRGVNGKNISELSVEETETLKKAMFDYGIKVSSIGSPIGKIKLTDDFEKHFELFKRVVEISSVLDSKYIRIFSFYHNGGNWSADERDRVISNLKKMIEYAKAEDIILLHENEKDIYGDNADRCFDLMKELYCDNFKAVFDPANFVQCGQNTKAAYEIIKPYIEYMHIKDAHFADGSVTVAGDGDGNVEYILSDLFKNGYCGFLSLEPHLGSFKGLSKLELDDVMEKLPQGGEGTFTLAFNALNNIIKNLGVGK